LWVRPAGPPRSDPPRRPEQDTRRLFRDNTRRIRRPNRDSLAARNSYAASRDGRRGLRLKNGSLPTASDPFCTAPSRISIYRHRSQGRSADSLQMEGEPCRIYAADGPGRWRTFDLRRPSDESALQNPSPDDSEHVGHSESYGARSRPLQSTSRRRRRKSARYVSAAIVAKMNHWTA